MHMHMHYLVSMHHADLTAALKTSASLYSLHAAGKGHENLRMFPSMDP